MVSGEISDADAAALTTCPYDAILPLLIGKSNNSAYDMTNFKYGALPARSIAAMILTCPRTRYWYAVTPSPKRHIGPVR